MKKMLLMAFLFPAFCFAQNVASVEKDKFTNQKRILTDDLLIINAKNKWPHFFIQFRAVDTSCYVILHGEDYTGGVVSGNDVAVLLMDDGSKVTVFSTGLQSYQNTYNGTLKEYRQQYRISLQDLQKLTTNKITAVRRFYADRYQDIDIISDKEQKQKELDRQQKHADEAQGMAQAFYNEIIKS